MSLITDPDDDILFETRGRIGLVTLNRPKALNALTHDMARRLADALRLWAEDDRIAAVAIRGAGERAFCAGGDIRELYEAGRERALESMRFYADEYRMNALIHEYPKPYIAFMDGVTMGGGAGVSVHGARRIAGGRTLFAMPETGIGLFPDVGASWFLPRLPGETGMWMALTSARLGPADAVTAGICDLFIPTDSQPAALEALCEARFEDEGGALDETDRILAPFSADPGEDALTALRAPIDHAFGADGVEEVLARLRADDGDWARAQLAELAKKCPVSLRITFREMREGARLAFRDCLRMEFVMARFCLMREDFYEGVRTAIIDKHDAPRWSPATLAQADAAYVSEAFAQPPEGQELSF